MTSMAHSVTRNPGSRLSVLLLSMLASILKDTLWPKVVVGLQSLGLPFIGRRLMEIPYD